ncbi:MAG: phosphodiester glycosidase family protein [bacterium]
MMKTRRTSWIGVALLLACGGTARAEPGAGTLADPVVIDDFPYAAADDTTGRGQEIDAYACNTGLDESGPEVVYRLELPDAGRLAAWVEGDDYVNTDIDIHLLSSVAVSGGEAVDCIARANLAIEVDNLPAGTYWLVVDSYVDAGNPLPGPYELRVDFIGYDVWRERTVARGVVWRQRLYPDLYGVNQTANVLVVDPTDPDVTVVPVEGNGCETPASMGARVGAVAAMNAGFFVMDGQCGPVGLVKIDGQLLATNGTNRAALGFDTAGVPLMDWVDAGQDWPAAHHALGGLPMLMQDSVVEVTWELEGAGSSFTFSRHPRTAACVDGGGNVRLVTFDGRTDAGGGIALDDLADWLSGQGCVDAMNFDGGGSTSMWIAGQPYGGVVSYPSDNSTADHSGARAVGNAWTIFATPYNHPPRFTTTPGNLDASEGVLYVYDADALDLDVYDTLTFGLVSGPSGAAVDPVTGELGWTPGYRDGGPRSVVISVSDGETLVEQPFTLLVTVLDTDGDGLPDTWETESSTDPSTPDAGEDPDGDGYTNAEEYELGSDPQDPDDPGTTPGDAGVDSGDATPPGGSSGGCDCRAGVTDAPPIWLILLVLAWFRRRL